MRHSQFQKISGQSATTARWSDCESYVMAFFDWIVGQKFVMQEFDESAKDSVSNHYMGLNVKKTRLPGVANNTGANQHAHKCSLISAFCLLFRK